MKGREYRLCTRRVEISLYHRYTMWKSWVGSRTSWNKRLIDLIYRSILIIGYLYIFTIYARPSRRSYLHHIHFLISRRCIGVSFDWSKSIAHSTIPVGRCDWGYFSWGSLRRIRWIWLCKRREIIHRAVYTSEDEKREKCAEPFLLSILTLSWNEMFHKLYKKSKIIIAYISSYVNTYFIKYINVKYWILIYNRKRQTSPQFRGLVVFPPYFVMGFMSPSMNKVIMVGRHLNLVHSKILWVVDMLSSIPLPQRGQKVPQKFSRNYPWFSIDLLKDYHYTCIYI